MIGDCGVAQCGSREVSCGGRVRVLPWNEWCLLEAAGVQRQCCLLPWPSNICRSQNKTKLRSKWAIRLWETEPFCCYNEDHTTKDCCRSICSLKLREQLSLVLCGALWCCLRSKTNTLNYFWEMCIGFSWPHFLYWGSTGVASVRSCLEVPLCLCQLTAGWTHHWPRLTPSAGWLCLWDNVFSKGERGCWMLSLKKTAAKLFRKDEKNQVKLARWYDEELQNEWVFGCIFLACTFGIKKKQKLMH